MADKALPDEHKRLLGVAISMALADGELDSSERALIDDLCDRLGLSIAGRASVEQMLANPPSPIQIVSWCLNDRDRIGIYAIASQMALADGHQHPRELAMLERFAGALGLSEEEVAEAEKLSDERLTKAFNVAVGHRKVE